MSNADLPQSYDEYKYDSDGPGPEVAKEPKSPETHDLEAGLLQPKDDAHSRPTHGSSVSRALRSIRWKRDPIPENEVVEKAEGAPKPPEYTEEARKLVRSFTQKHFDQEQKQAR